MRILVLSNFYPPFTYGGMELTCRSVVEGLKHRGHQTLVLTSRYSCERPTTGENVARYLYFEMDFAGKRNVVDFFLFRKRRQAYNRSVLRHTIAQFKPDVVYIWGMWNLPHVLAKDAEEIMEGRVLYRFGDYWPSLPSQHVHYWLAPGKSLPARIVKAVLRPVVVHMLQHEPSIALRFPVSYCISHAVKTHLMSLGVPIAQAAVIYNGIDMAPFDEMNRVRRSEARDLTKWLFIGRLTPEKGPHLAIEALVKVMKRNSMCPVHLSFAGSGSQEYIAELHEMVSNYNISKHIGFLGSVPSAEIPSLLYNHGVLIVPSVWQEPFGRVVIEGMAAGCVVIGSRTGGIPEIITHMETGLLFSPDDVNELVKYLEKVVGCPKIGKCLARNGSEHVRECFELEHMITEVEALLEHTIVNGTPGPRNNNGSKHI